jgi:thiamine-phosphate pyrophosphorylase
LRRIAQSLAARRRPKSDLPALWFFTDPARTPDAAAVIARLPRGAGVVFRAFGSPEAEKEARALRSIAHRRGVMFFVGADLALARRVKADGVHLPERLAHRPLRTPLRRTAAAHSLKAAIRARRAGVEAVFVSAVFPSRSPSAGAPIGPLRLADWGRRAGLPVFALGGVNARTAPRLMMTGAAGFAAVEALQH